MSDTPNVRPPGASLPEDGGDSLQPGARLAEFEIRQVLGAGGFGIVYRAWDEALQREVALKEYMPVAMAGRGAGERVTLRSRSHEENFAIGLQSFVNEARLLARFDQPALVKVFRFWEANGTAYMAMPLYHGRTLRQLRKEMAPGALDDAWAHALIEPLLGALEVMHDAAVYHRDIAPDNILWCDDQRPVLLDFGAARLVLADRTQNVTAILKPQFAPIEQYAETPAMRQGPWTDLYALAGTCYFMLTGRAPLPATARVMGDELVPLAVLAPPGCSQRLLQALDWAMAVRPQDRPQSVAQLREALAGRLDIPARANVPASATSAPTSTAADAYEKTILATTRVTRETPVSAPRPEAGFENAERSVMLPPKSRLPLTALLLIVAIVAVAAGAWATRGQWLAAVGLQAAAPAPVASAPEAQASAVAAEAASAVVAPAASAASAASSEPAASPAAAPAAKPVFEPMVDAPPSEAPPSRPTRSRPSEGARAKAAATHLPAFVLPPPVLPPAPETHGTAPAAPASAAIPAPDAAPATSGPRPLRGPREACTEREPTAVAACVKRVCDDDPRYQFYPICQALHRRGGSQ